MKRKSAKPVLAALLVTSLMLEAIPVTAQIEEVVVTARKREESIMKVPVVTSNLGSEQLESFALDDLTRIADQVPGLVLGSSSLSFGVQVSLRGVGTSVLQSAIDQSVSLNVDGLQLTQGLAYQSAMFDMEQVSVLKGPQGLFFGKASPGGVISVKTANPTEEFEVILRTGYEFEAEEDLVELILSGPVSDTLGFRLAGSFSDAAGYFDNDATALPGTGATDPKYDTIADSKDTMLRGTLVWDATDRLTSRLKVNYAKSEVDGWGGEPQLASCPDGIRPSAIFGQPFIGGGEDCKLDDTQRTVGLDPAAFPLAENGGVPFMDAEQVYGSLELSYELNDVLTLNSVTGYYDIDQSVMINGTATTYAGPLFNSQNTFQREDFTQELRLTSNYTDQPVNFMIGAFFQDASMTFTVDVLGNRALGGPSRLARADHEVEVDAYSFFGQVLWDITNELELGVGARWTDEDREYRQIDLISGSPVITPMATPKIGSTDLSPEVSLTYTPSDELTIFGALKQAYKSGSFDTTGAFAPGQENAFDDEEVRGGEVGVKARLLDGRLMTNASAYYNKYKDMQVGANSFDEQGTLVVRTLNAASADIYGVDFDVAYMPTSVPGMTLMAAVNWNIAEYDKFNNALCWGGQRIQDGCDQLYNATTGLYTAQDLSGEELLRAPEWTANFGVDYQRPVGNGMTVIVGFNTSYSADYYTSITLRDDMKQDSYYKHSASVALQGKDEGWVVELIGNNLNDEIVTGNCIHGNYEDGGPVVPNVSGAATRGPSGVDELLCLADRGRALWLRLTLRPDVLIK